MRVLIFLCLSIFWVPWTCANGMDSTFQIFTQDNRQGLTNAKGDVVIPAKYDELGWSKGSPTVRDETIGFRIGSKWGIISTSNEIIAAATYNQLYFLKDDLLIAGIPEKFYNRDLKGVISTRNKTTIPFKYHSIEAIKESFIVSKINEGEFFFGLLDTKGEALIPFRFNSIEELNEQLVLVENQEQKFAVFTLQGNQKTGFIYDTIESWNSYLKVNQVGKIGLLHLNTTEYLPTIYKEIKMTDGVVAPIRFPEWTLLTANNSKTDLFSYDSLKVFKGGYAVYANGYRSILDSTFNYVETDSLHFTIHYDTIIKQANLLFAGKGKKDDLRWSVLNHGGRTLSIKKYQEIGLLSEGLIPVKHDDFWGFIDTHGFEIIFNSFQWVSGFRKGLSMVKFHDHYGLINQDGEWVNLPLYPTLKFVRDRSYIYTKRMSYGILDGYNEVVYKTGNKLEPYFGRILETNQENKYGLVDLDGTIIFHTDFDTIIFSPKSNHFILEKAGNFILHDVNSHQEYSLDHSITQVYQPTEGFFGIKANNKYGFVDYEGKLRISNRYDSILPVKNDLIPFMLRGKWGLIDRAEKIIVQPLYQWVDPVSEKNIIVLNEKGYGVLNSRGQVIIEPGYSSISAMKRGDLRVRKNKKYGVLDEQGHVLVNTLFEDIEEINGEYYKIRRNGKFGLINAVGISTIPPIYDELIYDPETNAFFGKINSN